MGEKIVAVDRKLGVTARKLVTTAGGAPCCCQTGPPGCPVTCSTVACVQCLDEDRPFYAPTYSAAATNGGSFTTSELAAIRTAIRDQFAGFECASCESSRVVIDPWQFTCRTDNSPTISVNFLDEITLCFNRFATGAGNRQLWTGRQIGSLSAFDISWWHPNYGFGYSNGRLHYESPFEPPRYVKMCKWESDVVGPGGVSVSLIDPSRVLVNVRNVPTSFNQTVPATRVVATACLYRVTEYVADQLGTLPQWRDFLGSVILVVEYEIECAFGTFYVIPSPPFNANDDDKSTVVQIQDWGGWISCKKVRFTEFSGGAFGIAALPQSYIGCNATSVCGSVFSPIGVTIFTPFGLDAGGANSWAELDFIQQWPTNFPTFDLFTNSGYEARIVGEYGSSCSDPPPGLLGLV